MNPSNSIHSQHTYEVIILGQVDDSWLEWFGAEAVKRKSMVDQCPTTTLSGIQMDQAGLVGLIRRLHGLGLLLVSVQRVTKKAQTPFST